jgi:hypothetical protein
VTNGSDGNAEGQENGTGLDLHRVVDDLDDGIAVGEGRGEHSTLIEEKKGRTARWRGSRRP